MTVGNCLEVFFKSDLLNIAKITQEKSRDGKSSCSNGILLLIRAAS